jgi:C-terminal processing protease CtpA/Prc
MGIIACFAFGPAIAADGPATGASCDPQQAVAVEAGCDEPLYGADAVRADLAQLLSVITATHPDPDLSFDHARLQRTTRELAAALPERMNAREAWLTMARLNPHFHDAHTGLRHPAAAYEASLAAGSAAFPVPVFVDRDGRLRASATVGSETGLAAYDTIASINGRETAGIIADLMPRMRGETESIQRLALTFNFPAHLWALLGPQKAYCVGIETGNGQHRHILLAGDKGQAPLQQRNRASSAFGMSMPAPGVALLRVGSFDPGLKEVFAAFLDDSFAALDANGVKMLLIDLRDNPGGAHDVSDQLVGYLTDSEVPTASMLLARITGDNRELAPEAEPGSVVRVPFREPIQRRATRTPFKGNVYVLVSRDTYSQAIVFAATLKDAGIARIIGETTGGNANQTGQIVVTPLANTGLQALAPLYVIYRPNGDTTMAGLQPDIPLLHDPIRPQRMVEAALDAIERE